jgi:multiple sugar transport system ATP-binding protein
MSTEIAVMRAGKLQQFAPPSEVYRYPANLFVADFIGNPKINLLQATATPGDDGTCLHIDSFDIRGVPVRATGPVVAAVRPEDIQIGFTPSPQAVECMVYSVLPAGSEVIVNARRRSPSGERNNLMLTIKETRAVNIEMDRCVWLTFDPKAINLFDKETSNLIPALAGEMSGGGCI